MLAAGLPPPPPSPNHTPTHTPHTHAHTSPPPTHTHRPPAPQPAPALQLDGVQRLPHHPRHARRGGRAVRRAEGALPAVLHAGKPGRAVGGGQQGCRVPACTRGQHIQVEAPAREGRPRADPAPPPLPPPLPPQQPLRPHPPTANRLRWCGALRRLRPHSRCRCCRLKGSWRCAACPHCR